MSAEVAARMTATTVTPSMARAAPAAAQAADHGPRLCVTDDRACLERVRARPTRGHVLPSRRMAATSLRESFGHRPHYLLAERAGAIRGVLPLAEVKSLLFGHALVSTPFCVYGGILAADEQSHAALTAAACELAQRAGRRPPGDAQPRAQHPDWPSRTSTSRSAGRSTRIPRRTCWRSRASSARWCARASRKACGPRSTRRRRGTTSCIRRACATSARRCSRAATSTPAAGVRRRLRGR